MKRRRLMQAITRAFDEGNIVLAPLHAPNEVLDGLHVRTTIADESVSLVYVDIRPQTVETLLHELLHRAFPRWGEHRVSYTANYLMRTMTNASRRKWLDRLKARAVEIDTPIKTGKV